MPAGLGACIPAQAGYNESKGQPRATWTRKAENEYDDFPRRTRSREKGTDGGGKGHVLIEHLLDEEQLNGKCRMYAHVRLEPGLPRWACIRHHGETETYYILSGEGLYYDNDRSYPVKAGDVTFCADGGTHGLDNTGDTNLEFMALIIKG